MNEPASRWWKFAGWQEGCHFDLAGQQRIIQLLSAELRQFNLPAVVAAPDDNSIDETLAALVAFSPPTLGSIGQINTHSYHGTRRTALYDAARRLGRRLVMSEYGDGDASGLTMAQRIVLDMRELRPAAWVYWQAIDSGGWGFLNCDLNGAATHAAVSQKYYVMMQFSRHIQPGFRFMDTNDAHTVAAWHPSLRRLVVINVNSSAAARTLTLHLHNFQSTGAAAHGWRTSAAERHRLLSPQPVRQARVLLRSNAGSVTTWVIHNCLPRGG